MLTADTITSQGDLRVADLMTIDPITVVIDATIEEAEDLMRRHASPGSRSSTRPVASSA